MVDSCNYSAKHYWQQRCRLGLWSTALRTRSRWKELIIKALNKIICKDGEGLLKHSRSYSLFTYQEEISRRLCSATSSFSPVCSGDEGMHLEKRVICGKSLLCALCIRGWESALPLLKGRQQRHRLSTNRHPFYDPHAVAAVVNTGFLGFLWRLLREKLTTRKRYWLLYIWLATLGSKCVMRRSRLDSREIQAQNPHLSVCVCPMLLAGATSTAYGDLCRRRS